MSRMCKRNLLRYPNEQNGIWILIFPSLQTTETLIRVCSSTGTQQLITNECCEMSESLHDLIVFGRYALFAIFAFLTVWIIALYVTAIRKNILLPNKQDHDQPLLVILFMGWLPLFWSSPDNEERNLLRSRILKLFVISILCWLVIVASTFLPF